jgi:hypothetical protein
MYEMYNKPNYRSRVFELKIEMNDLKMNREMEKVFPIS